MWRIYERVRKNACNAVFGTPFSISQSKGNMEPLCFNKAIVSTVSKSISTKELLTRLQTLSDELSSIDQDKVDRASLTSITKDLINKKLLKHSNAGVQALTCCCLADILRIYAPDAPYTALQLSLIFQCMFQQFKRLCDPQNPFVQHQTYLLKRLAEVKSIILITDLPDSEKLIDQVFEVLYELASHKDFPRNLEPLASDILSEIILETDQISTAVLKRILNRLLTDSADGAIMTGGGISNPGFNFSIAICEANVDRMSRQIAKLFSEMLYENTSKGGADADESLRSALVLENLRKVHRLAILIWKYVPEMLLALIGLIDDELKAEDEKIRVLATDTIGQMIGRSSGTTIVHKVDFVAAHNDIWQNWLKKAVDGSAAVRCKWVDQIPRIVQEHAQDTTSTREIDQELVKGLMCCLLDCDEKVRFTACKCIAKVPAKVFISRVCNREILDTLFKLLREKNSEIRDQVMRLLGKVFNSYLDADRNTSLLDFESSLKDIPNQILSLIYINDRNITAAVDIALFEQLLPFESNDMKRVERLCQVYFSLNEKSRNSFLAINKRQQQVGEVIDKFLDTVETIAQMPEDKENELAQLKSLDKIITWLCASLPEGLHSKECLERLYKLRNYRLFHLLKVGISVDSDYTTMKNAMKELLSKLNNPKNLRLSDDKTTISTTDMISNVKLLVYRSSMILFNRSNVLLLMNFARNKTHQWSSVADELLECVSTVNPELLKDLIEEMAELISTYNAKENEELTSTLKSFYHFVRKYKDHLPTSLAFINALKAFCVAGSPAEAKYASKIISQSNKRNALCTEVFHDIYPLDLESEKITTHLATIAEIFLSEPLVVAGEADEITTFLIKEVLLQNRTTSDVGEAWIEEPERFPALNAKIIALNIFTNRLKSSNESEALALSQPIFKLLMALIGNGGEIVSDNSTPKAFQCRLRLHAGLCILKLAKFAKLSEHFSMKVTNRLTFLLQDLNWNIRQLFLLKLQKYLSFELIPESFLPLVFFMGHEPDADLKSSAERSIRAIFHRLSGANGGSIKFEVALLGLIHMISHTSEFKEFIASDTDDDVIKAYTYAMEYIVFYLKGISKAENVSLLYYIASRVKQYRDATLDENLYDQTPAPVDVKTLYSVAEIAQLTIRELCQTRNWTMQTWPGKIKLAPKLFAPMKSTDEAQAIIRQAFVPTQVLPKLTTIIKSRLNAKSRIATKNVSNTGTTKAKRSTSSNVGTKTKRLKKSAPRATTNKSAEPSRRSSRARKQVTYAEGNSDEDEDASDVEESSDDSDFSS